MTATTYALTNQKGGVGKTTCTYHLARAGSRAGLRVLVVDLDPQGNLTSFLSATDDGEPLPEDTAGLADVLSRTVDTELRDVILPTIWEGVDMVPTVGEALGSVREELTIAGAGRESRLKLALANVLDDYDVVMIDCPPSLDQLTGNGLTAADSVVVISESRMASASGLAKLLDTIGQVQQFYNPALTIVGVIVNKHEEGTRTGRHWLPEIESAAEARGFPVLRPLVPKRTVIGDAPELSRGLDQGDADSRALGTIFDGYMQTLAGAKR